MQHHTTEQGRTASSAALSRLAVTVPADLRRAAKSTAALRGQTLAGFVADAVRRALDTEPENEGVTR